MIQEGAMEADFCGATLVVSVNNNTTNNHIRWRSTWTTPVAFRVGLPRRFTSPFELNKDHMA